MNEIEHMKVGEDELWEEWARWGKLMATGKTGPLDNDIVRAKPELERKREWEHGREGAGKDCTRQKVYTAPEKIPDTCRRPHCDNTEWYSKGVVVRNKATKEILEREG